MHTYVSATLGGSPVLQLNWKETEDIYNKNVLDSKVVCILKFHQCNIYTFVSSMKLHIQINLKK